MKLKKILISALFFFLISGLSVFAEITVKINDRLIAMDTPPFITENTTLIPVRFIAESLNCDVLWDDSENKVTLISEDKRILLYINKKNAVVNGKKHTLTTPPVIQNNRTYVPLRFIAENLDMDVFWDNDTKTVLLYKNDYHLSFPYSEDDLVWLSKIIHAESQGEPFEGKLAVGNVILNRTFDENFPNTIYEVIFDRKNGVQFTPVANGAINNSPSNESIYAADKALRGENNISYALFFCNPDTSTSKWIINTRPFFKRIGKHNFYL